jgi:hypothetical protein
LPDSNPNQIQGLGKSVFLGGGAAGILSIFPGLNLLNLFFMFWIVMGAGLTIFLLRKENPRLKKSDALLAGALSGLTGGAIFAILSIFTIAGISQEQLDQLVETAKAAAPFLRDNQAATLASGQLKTIMIISIGLFVLAAIAVGAVAGLIARKIFRPERKEQP